MKKLNRKGQVHPSAPPPPPPSPPPATITNHLSMLPATILSLTAALSLQDKEVLAYLISCSSSSSSLATTTTSNNFHGHDSTFECYCFRCYMCFWARWDSSPNRQQIHEIIEAYEEVLQLQFQDQKKQVKKKNKKGRRNGVCFHDPNHGNDQGNSGKDSVSGEDGEVAVEAEIGSIMKIVSFIRDSVWEAWKIF